MEVEDNESRNYSGCGRRREIGITACACVHCLTLLTTIQININTRGTDNGDMKFIPHTGGGGVMEDVGRLCGKGPLPGEEVPDFTGSHRVLQCCTLSGVISHKASLILHQEQLRGL